MMYLIVGVRCGFPTALGRGDEQPGVVGLVHYLFGLDISHPRLVVMFVFFHVDIIRICPGCNSERVLFLGREDVDTPRIG
jgi:hypothetical protein